VSFDLARPHRKEERELHRLQKIAPLNRETPPAGRKSMHEGVMPLAKAWENTHFEL
jgi:hypothetical protein